MDSSIISRNNNRESASTSTTSNTQDIIRSYHPLANLKRKLMKTSMKSFDQLINPEQQLLIAKDKKAELIPAEVLYAHGNKEKVYQHYSEELILCCNPNEQVTCPLINTESKRKLIAQNYKLIHVGLVMIAIHGLHRTHFGSKVFIALADTRNSDPEKAIIGQMEVDMTKNHEIIYLIPDFMLTIKDFSDHFSLIIKTKGYENWTSGESNLLITKACIARISNNSQYSFKLQIQDAISYLSSQGIRAIPGRKYHTTNNQGQEWKINIDQTQTQHPTNAVFWKNQDNSFSTIFTDYVQTSHNNNQPDEDSEQHETVFMNINYEDPDYNPNYDDTYDYNPFINSSSTTFDPSLDEFANPEDYAFPSFPNTFTTSESQQSVVDPATTSSPPSSSIPEFTPQYIPAYPLPQDIASYTTTPEENHPDHPETQNHIIDTLGEPSGKYDYLVRYDRPYIPDLPIIPDNWGEDNQPEQDSRPPLYNTENNEYQIYHDNVDEYIEEYIPEEEYLPESVQSNYENESEEEIIYQPPNTPFTTYFDYPKYEKSFICELNEEDIDKLYEDNNLYLFEQLNKDEEFESDLPYPTQTIERIHMAETSTSTATSLPTTRVTSQPQNIAPATASTSRTPPLFVPTQGRETGRGRPIFYDNIPTLPSANTQTGSMLVLGDDIAHWEDRIRRWESNTITHIASKVFSENTDKVIYIENLLGETAKLYFQNWRAAYPQEFNALIMNADETTNITGQIRQIILGYDEYKGQTEMQNQALLNIERLTINNMKDFAAYSAQYLNFASKTGAAFLSTELSDKYFRKLPQPFNTKLPELWNERFPNMTVGIAPRINFTYQILQDYCRQNELTRQVKDYSFCKTIEVPGLYQTYKPKKILRRSTTYKGKNPHTNNVRKFKTNKPGLTKCKCYICGEDGHFANQCKNRTANRDRLAIYQELDLTTDWDIVSLEENEDPNDSDICSFSDNEDDKERTEFINSQQEDVWMITLEWNPQRAHKTLTEEMKNCTHHFENYIDVAYNENRCYFCNIKTVKRGRTKCMFCNLLICITCAEIKLNIQIPMGHQQPPIPLADTREVIRQQAQHIVDLEKEIQYLKQQKNNVTKQKQKIVIREIDDIDEEFMIKAETHEKDKRLASITNNLLNLNAILEIEGNEYSVQAILDTGASKCCIDHHALPSICYEQCKQLVTFHGLDSEQSTQLKVKNGFITLNKEKYPLPITYVMKLGHGDRTQLIIGMNFVYGFRGGLRIEQGQITFYKKVDHIQTTPISKILLSEISVEEEQLDYLMYNEMMNLFTYNIGKLTDYQNEIYPLLKKLEKLQIIGDDPLRHWKNNQIKCKLDLKNPDYQINDKPIVLSETQSLEMKKHLDILLKLKLIRPSQSKHRTSAFLVFSGSDVAPDGTPIKKKARVVYNYTRLNDNTYKDSYALPSIDYLLLKIRNKDVYSKFDLKSGFHQIAMHEDSIEWTAFVCPYGLYEWLVMPFGLKNAPAVFQRKMDCIFNQYADFMVAYIDDILIFSDNIADHVKHLKIFFSVCEKEGLILSKTKLKIGVSKIEFLGLEIGKGIIKLQPHIIKCISDFPIEQLKTLKGLQRFLGILNYARNYIPNLSKLTGNLYSKTGPKGVRELNKQDIKNIEEIKHLIKHLPDLELPPPNSYIIIECDGSMLGWGGILKWKPSKGSLQSTEKIARYTSGKYKTSISAIDAEIMACIYTLDKFKIFIMDKKEFTLRTDCEAIVNFFHKINSNKLSRNRWINFIDHITQTGVEVQIEHIKGKSNLGADRLSRIISTNPYF